MYLPVYNLRGNINMRRACSLVSQIIIIDSEFIESLQLNNQNIKINIPDEWNEFFFALRYATAVMVDACLFAKVK